MGTENKLFIKPLLDQEKAERAILLLEQLKPIVKQLQEIGIEIELKSHEEFLNQVFSPS